MTKKIFRNIIAVTATTVLMCFVIILGILYDHFETRLKTELKEEAEYVSRGVEAAGLDYFNNITAQNRITWINSDGTVIYDTDADVSDMENHLDRSEVNDALKNGSGIAVRYSYTILEKSIYYAKRISDGTVIRISASQYTIWTLVLGMLQPMLVVFFIAIILSAIMASRVSKRIVKPINEINLDKLDVTNEDYEEIAPFLTKINHQKSTINKQLAELKSKNEEFSKIIENMNEGLLVIDKNADILLYNASALKHLGAKEGRFEKSVFTINRNRNFCHSIEEALQGKNNIQQYIRDDRYYQIIANAIYTDEEISGAIIIIMDITEKEQREMLRREFTSNVSHELKTPLTSIYGISDLIANGMVKNDSDIKKFGNRIHDETGRLIELVNDILKISKLDEGDIPNEPEEVDLYDIASIVKERLENIALQNKITIDLHGGHVKVMGDSQIIEEMIYNLCDNSIKYNSEGGKVIIRTDYINGVPQFCVEDNGIGIPEDAKERVFERFYRVDKSRSKANGGTGLGLSIVKHGAMYHNAKLELESQESKGTKITVIFPQ
ncbi:MAG: ATP-binding protein [Eubacterium sp.]